MLQEPPFNEQASSVTTARHAFKGYPTLARSPRFHGTVEMSTRPKDQTRIRATSFADPNAARESSKPSNLGVRVSRKSVSLSLSLLSVCADIKARHIQYVSIAQYGNHTLSHTHTQLFSKRLGVCVGEDGVWK